MKTCFKIGVAALALLALAPGIDAATMPKTEFGKVLSTQDDLPCTQMAAGPNGSQVVISTVKMMCSMDPAQAGPDGEPFFLPPQVIEDMEKHPNETFFLDVVKNTANGTEISSDTFEIVCSLKEPSTTMTDSE